MLLSAISNAAAPDELDAQGFVHFVQVRSSFDCCYIYLTYYCSPQFLAFLAHSEDLKDIYSTHRRVFWENKQEIYSY